MPVTFDEVLAEEWSTEGRFALRTVPEGVRTLAEFHGFGPDDSSDSDVRRANVAVLGKRALAMMLKAKLVNGEDPCPGCRSRWTGNGVHLDGCEWASILAAVEALQ